MRSQQQQRQAVGINKTRIRDQIRSQVEEFLRRGGEIRVVDNGASTNGKAGAPAWQGYDPIGHLLD